MNCRSNFFATSIFLGAYVFIIGAGHAAAQGASPPPAVSVAPVASRQVTEIGDFIGRVAAIDKVDIVARVSGFIQQRNFTEGQQVKTGDLLFRIEPDIYKATVDQQNANLDSESSGEQGDLVHEDHLPSADSRGNSDPRERRSWGERG
jgi:multidrug efflux pump subunit AcrA (membrane-fusion protein)